MKIRGFAFLLAGLPFWLRAVHLFNAAKNGPFCYELGSIAYPVPPKIYALGLTGQILLLIGIFFLVVDCVRWIRKRP